MREDTYWNTSKEEEELEDLDKAAQKGELNPY
jgi:hypothetical protein